jgi:hypothetical protein
MIILASLVIMAASTAAAQDIYHWVDENGVPNFSQERPPGSIQDFSELYLEDTTPIDYDPEQDIYGIEEQAERMQALREDMEKRRQENREREKYVVQQPVQQYRDPYQFYSRRLWYPPLYPKPPHRPKPPIAVPYETATLQR